MNKFYGGGGVESRACMPSDYAAAHDAGGRLASLSAQQVQILPASTLSGYVEALFAEQYARDAMADSAPDFGVERDAD